MQETIEASILKVMQEQGVSLAGLGRSTHVTTEHIFYVLKGKPGEKRKLSSKLLARINDALGTDFSLSGQQTSEGTPAADSPTK